MNNYDRRKQKRYYKCLTIIIAALVFIQSITAGNFVKADLINLEKVRNINEIVMDDKDGISDVHTKKSIDSQKSNSNILEIKSQVDPGIKKDAEEIVSESGSDGKSIRDKSSNLNQDEADRDKSRKPRATDDVPDRPEELKLSPMAMTAAQNAKPRMVNVSVDSYVLEGNGDNPNVVRPNDNNGIRTSILFNIPDGHKKGDYFTFSFDDNINPGGTNIHFILGNIVHPKTNELIATPEYDPNTKTIKYTFTDYIERHENVIAGFRLANSGTNRERLTHSGHVTFINLVNGRPIEPKTLEIIYNDHVRGISKTPEGMKDLSMAHFIPRVDNINNYIEYFIYLYPKKDINGMTIPSPSEPTELYIHKFSPESGVIIDEDTEVETYRVPYDRKDEFMTPSFTNDIDSLPRATELRKEFTNVGHDGKGPFNGDIIKYDINPRYLRGHTGGYIIKVRAKFDPKKPAIIGQNFISKKKNWDGTAPMWLYGTSNYNERPGDALGIGDEKEIVPKGRLTIKKVGENNEPLEGAMFSLQRRDNRKEMERTLEPKGITKFVDLDPGDYILREKSAPPGYKKSREEFYVRVYEDENIRSISNEVGTWNDLEVKKPKPRNNNSDRIAEDKDDIKDEILRPEDNGELDDLLPGETREDSTKKPGPPRPENNSFEHLPSNERIAKVRGYELISTGNQNQIVRPNSSEKIMMKLSLDIDDKVKQGDYFIINLDDKIKPEWLKPSFKAPDIVNGDGSVVARAKFDKASNRIKYVFTDYVNDKVKINIKLNLAMGVNRNIANTNYRYLFQNAIDNERLESKRLEVQYLKPTSFFNDSYINANSAVTKIDEINKKVEYTILLNPKGLYPSRRDRGFAPLYIYRGNDRGVNINRRTDVKVYTVTNDQIREYMGNEIPERNLNSLRQFRPESRYSNTGFEGNEQFVGDYWLVNFMPQNFTRGQGYIVKVSADYSGSPNDINIGFTWKFLDNFASQTQGIGDDPSSASYTGVVAPKRTPNNKPGRGDKKPGRNKPGRNPDDRNSEEKNPNGKDDSRNEEPMEHIITVVNKRDIPIVLPNTGGTGSTQFLAPGLSIAATSIVFLKRKKHIIKKIISLVTD